MLMKGNNLVVFISEFGAIKTKIAEQVVKTWVTESAVYRVSKNMDDLIQVHYWKKEKESEQQQLKVLQHMLLKLLL